MALAYNPLPVEPAEPYAIIPVEGDPYVEHHYLGTLTGYPEMYELTTDVALTLKVSLFQRSGRHAVPFGMIVVQQNSDDGGVTEIARSNQPLDTWKKDYRPTLGMTLLQTDTIEQELTPGTYRIEVSTPDNTGEYMLQIGDEAVSRGFFRKLADVRAIQKNFDYTILHVLFSSYLYLPLALCAAVYGYYGVRKYKREHAQFNS